ncbi:hypothetical protein ACFQY4_24475 [Catellatospora bangladeshensis]|uniref:hypothetical protein n=1 Tax=Catellatospora bangladeshensis TaxID=310355 RepID=UPI003609CE9E
MTTDRVTSPLAVVLTDVNAKVVQAWRSAFADTPRCGSCRARSWTSTSTRG